MKIYDCFPFFNELELLELRFMELGSTVDHFVLVEADRTHTGKPKPLYFEEHKADFAPWLDQVIHVKVTDSPPFNPDFLPAIEFHQHAATARGLVDAVAGDRIIFGDADEIPSADAVRANLDRPAPVFLRMHTFLYYVNCRRARPCGGAVIAPYVPPFDPGPLRRLAKRRIACVPSRGSGDYCRKHPDVYRAGGWHYTSLGDAARLRLKAESIWESERLLEAVGSVEDIQRKIDNLADLFGRDDPKHALSLVDVPQPRALGAWLEKYPQFWRAA